MKLPAACGGVKPRPCPGVQVIDSCGSAKVAGGPPGLQIRCGALKPSRVGSIPMHFRQFLRIIRCFVMLFLLMYSNNIIHYSAELIASDNNTLKGSYCKYGIFDADEVIKDPTPFLIYRNLHQCVPTSIVMQCRRCVSYLKGVKQ